jgi:ABC-type branched-subunit amino acid transport system permease subunit
MFMFGNLQQLHAPRPAGLTSDTRYYYVVLAVTAACCAAVVFVRRSRLGRLLRALSESPAALAAHGTDVNVTRVFVFCISEILAGVARAVIGPVTESATGPTFDFSISLMLVAVLAVAGANPLLSAFVAAALHIVVPSYLTDATLVRYSPILFGVAAIATAAGSARVVHRWLDSRRGAERAASTRVRTRLVTA